MNKDDEISVDMGLLGTLSVKLTKEIGALMTKHISQQEMGVLEGFLTLIHSNLAVMTSINDGLRPEGFDINKYVFSYSDAIKEISEVVRSHPQYTTI